MTTDPKELAKARHILTLRDENVPGCCVSDAAPVAEAYLASEVARKGLELTNEANIGLVAVWTKRSEKAEAAREEFEKRADKSVWVMASRAADLRTRAEKAEAAVARLTKAFAHYHVGPEESCGKCGLDIRNAVHIRLASPGAGGEE